mmetsp:Transcript_72866/g.236738  ORF Transcript_72866/g.236738 Transcript_72866/m.236738 type:complete len:204 (-) Transcript_72866:291-902(-)
MLHVPGTKSAQAARISRGTPMLRAHSSIISRNSCRDILLLALPDLRVRPRRSPGPAPTATSEAVAASASGAATASSCPSSSRHCSGLSAWYLETLRATGPQLCAKSSRKTESARKVSGSGGEAPAALEELPPTSSSRVAPTSEAAEEEEDRLRRSAPSLVSAAYSALCSLAPIGSQSSMGHIGFGASAPSSTPPGPAATRLWR